jgi:hypothetical protein
MASGSIVRTCQARCGYGIGIDTVRRSQKKQPCFVVLREVRTGIVRASKIFTQQRINFQDFNFQDFNESALPRLPERDVEGGSIAQMFKCEPCREIIQFFDRTDDDGARRRPKPSNPTRRPVRNVRAA